MPTALLTGAIFKTYQPASTSQVDGTFPSARGAFVPSRGSSETVTPGPSVRAATDPALTISNRMLDGPRRLNFLRQASPGAIRGALDASTVAPCARRNAASK